MTKKGKIVSIEALRTMSQSIEETSAIFSMNGEFAAMALLAINNGICSLEKEQIDVLADIAKKLEDEVDWDKDHPELAKAWKELSYCLNVVTLFFLIRNKMETQVRQNTLPSSSVLHLIDVS